MRSTTELKQHKSGKRDSNPRPPAWKASALSTELFPQKPWGFCASLRFAELQSKLSLVSQKTSACSLSGFPTQRTLRWESGGKRRFYCAWRNRCGRVAERVGADGFEPPKLKSSRFTVCPIWPLWNTPLLHLINVLSPIFQLARLAPRSLLSDSNQRPLDYKSSALPTELKRRLFQQPDFVWRESGCKGTTNFSIPQIISTKTDRLFPILTNLLSCAYILGQQSYFRKRQSVIIV